MARKAILSKKSGTQYVAMVRTTVKHVVEDLSKNLIAKNQLFLMQIGILVYHYQIKKIQLSG